MNPTIDIIIINWNGGQLLKKCVESILTSNYSSYVIHVLDNGSTDNSCSILETDEKLNIHYVGENLGFGRACNLALKYCSNEYVLLLNPDTIIKSTTISCAIKFLKDTNVAVYGAAQVNDKGNIMHTCGRFPNFFTYSNDVLGLYRLNNVCFKNGFIQHEWSHNESKFVDHVMGSFYLVRRKIIDELGFMDDRYFVYLEDLDLSKRIVAAGYKIYFDRDNVIYHKGGGISEQVKANRIHYSLHAKYQFALKHFDWFTSIVSLVILIFISPIARISYTLFIARSKVETKETLLGYRKFYTYLITKSLHE
jgi:GT2 family glycosyltransferase